MSIDGRELPTLSLLHLVLSFVILILGQCEIYSRKQNQSNEQIFTKSLQWRCVDGAYSSSPATICWMVIRHVVFSLR